MNNKLRKGIAAGLSALFVLSMCSCGPKTKNTTANNNAEDAKFKDAQYPLDTDVVLDYWCGIGEIKPGGAFAETLEKKTGIKINVINASTDPAQQKEQFNLLLASDDKPDIMEYRWADVAGGPDDVIKSNYIISLNEMIDTYSPNLKKYLSERPEIDRSVKTLGGQYYVYPFVREYDENRIYQGPIIRKDWLDDLGLAVPETMDEWYTALKAFKEQKGATAPLTYLTEGLLTNSAFIGAYGTGFGYYVVDGRIKYGQMEPGYKEYLTTMNKWYKEGLLDNNITTMDSVTMDANMTSGKSGASVAGCGGGLGKWLGLMKESNPEYNLVAAPYPSLKKGEKAMFNGIDYIVNGSGAAITPDCEHPIIAAKLLDYFYSEEGHLFSAFGTEGLTYNMVNGYPTYTDYVMNNPQGFSMSEILGRETRATFGPCVQDVRYFEQFSSLPQQRAAIGIWKEAEGSHKLPFFPKTAEEEKEFSKINGNVDTFMREWMMLFITGQQPMSAYDQYITTLKDMGIDRAVEIMQTAYDRYMQK